MFRKSLKSLLSIALCIVFMFTFVSTAAFAETVEDTQTEDTAQVTDEAVTDDSTEAADDTQEAEVEEEAEEAEEVEEQTEQVSQVSRLAGDNRYKTAVAISKKGWDKSEYAVIAMGQDFADALSAGPLAKKYDAPVLLTATNTISQDVLDELERLEVENVIIVGGVGAVSQGIENTLKALKVDDKAVTVKRIFGDDRFETSVEVAKEVGTSEEIVLATGYDYPDALSIAPIASSKGMPIILTEKNALPESVEEYMAANEDTIKKTYIVGGTGVVSADIEEVVINPVRLGGSDRYETNIAVMAAFADGIDFENIYVAVGDGVNGDEFADALSGAALAAKTSSPVVLMYKSVAVNTKALLALASSSEAKVIALGGAAVVPENAVEEIVTVIKVPIIGSNLGSTAQRGTEKEFQVATAAKGAKNEVVKVKITLVEGKDIATIQYKEVTDGKYYTLSFDENGVAWYGPSAGFPLGDIASDFKAAFNKTGKLEYKIEVVRVSDEAVLTRLEGSVNVSELALEGDVAKAYVGPQNFNTNLSEVYIGYNVGWKLTDAIALEDIAAMEVSLLDAEGNVLVTNTSTDKVFELDKTTKEFSTPFNVSKAIEFSDEYWTLGEWANGTEQPSKAEIKITNKNGDTYTVVNENLAIVAGDEDVAKYLDTYEKETLAGEEAEAYVAAQNFNTHFNVNNSLDYVGFNVGWKLTDDIALDELAKMEISLLDVEGKVLVTNTSTDKIFELDGNTKEFSTPFNINTHIEYEDEYWTFGEWLNGKTVMPSKAEIKITTIYGDTYTVINESLAEVEGYGYIKNYLSK